MANEIIVLLDFAENYSFLVQDAVQGYHWENSQAINQSINHILFCHKIKTVIHERIGYYFYTCGLGGLRSDLPVFESSSHLTFVGQ